MGRVIYLPMGAPILMLFAVLTVSLFPQAHAAKGQPVSLPTPEEGLTMILAEPYRLIGMEKFINDATISCVFRSPRAVLVHELCLGARESSALAVTVFPVGGGAIRYYAEGEGPVSQARRSALFTFRVTVFDRPAASQVQTLTFAQFKPFFQNWEAAGVTPSCHAGMDSIVPSGNGVLCYPNDTAIPDGKAWAERSMGFVEQLSSDWGRATSLLNTLRARARSGAMRIER